MDSSEHVTVGTSVPDHVQPQATGRTSTCPDIEVGWQRMPYRRRATFHIEASHLAACAGLTVTCSTTHPAFLPVSKALAVTQGAHGPSCSGRLRPGQTLRVCLTRGSGEAGRCATLLYSGERLGAISQGEEGAWLHVYRSGPQSSWEQESLRATYAVLALYILALVWELFALLCLSPTRQWRVLAVGCLLLLLWNVLGLYLERRNFPLGRALLPACILAGGISYWLFPLLSLWHAS
jgi:hypothetical protein